MVTAIGLAVVGVLAAWVVALVLASTAESGRAIGDAETSRRRRVTERRQHPNTVRREILFTNGIVAFDSGRRARAGRP
jgi:hypothetical protein